jgi:hypothetical protein
MKFGKITSKNVSTDALYLGGALAGGALSGGLMTFVPNEQEVLARGGMVGIGLLGAASVKGTSSADKVVKFLLLGMGIAQGAALIKKYAADSITIDAASTAPEKFVGGMVGLGCPCNGNGSYPALASPVINFAALSNSRTPEGSFTENSGVQTGAF